MRVLVTAPDQVPECYQVATTAPSREEAERLGRLALGQRLAACAQVAGPVSSTYWWRGEVTAAEEWLCTLKTTGERLDALVGALRAAHPYEVPEIVATAIAGGDADYLAWVDAEVGSEG